MGCPAEPTLKAHDPKTHQDPRDMSIKSESISNTVVQGATWMVGFAAISKILSVLCQFALPWFLLKQDFGLVGIALSISSIGAMFTYTGLHEVLVNDRENFSAKAPQVLWLSVCINIASAILVIAALPLIFLVYNKNITLIVLIGLEVLSWPIGGIIVPYRAKIHQNFLFHHLALVNFGYVIIFSLTSISLAAAGWGAYSLIVAGFPAKIFSAVAFRIIAGPLGSLKPIPSTWWPLLSKGLWMMANGLVTGLNRYGTTFVIGLCKSLDVVGLLYWSFTVSMQVVYLIADSLSRVLFPVFSSMHKDVKRMRKAVLISSLTMLTFLHPITILQVLFARPLIDWIYPDKWLGAGEIVSLLTVANFTFPFTTIVHSVLLATRRYRMRAIVSLITAFWVLTATGCAALQTGPRGIAITIVLASTTAYVLQGYWIFRVLGFSTKGILGAFGSIYIIGLLAMLCGTLALSFSSQCEYPLVVVGFTTGAVIVPYSLMLRLFQPQIFFTIKTRFAVMLRRSK